MTLRHFLDASHVLMVEDLQRIAPYMDLAQIEKKLAEVPAQAQDDEPSPAEVPSAADNDANLKLLLAQMPGKGMPG